MTTTTSDAAASRTLLGNLTTTFTQPASCTLAWLGAPDSGTASGWLAQDCHPVSRDEFTNEDDTDCWPPRMTGVPTPTATPRVWANGWGYYSPGYICPAGYITACSATAGGSSDFSMQFPLTAGETAIGCCPSGYACAYTGSSQTCIATMTTGEVPVGECTLLQPETSTVGNIPDIYFGTDNGTTTSARINTMILSAPLFQLNYHPTDLPTTTSSTTTAATSATTVDDSSSGGLSKGAQIGIGVGVGVGGLAIIAVAAWLFRRRRQDRKGAYTMQPMEQFPGQEQYPGQGPEESMYSYGSMPLSGATEYAHDSIAISEIDPGKTVAPVPVELMTHSFPAELAGNNVPLRDYKYQ